MTDYKHLRELAEAATPGPWTSVDDDGEKYSNPPATGAFLVEYGVDVDQKMRDIRYIANADPQTMVTLLDELRRVTEQRDELNRMHRECHGQRDSLQARIDAALAYVDDPGNWGTYDGRRRLLHDLLSTPAESEGDE